MLLIFIGTKHVYIFSHLIYSVGMLLLALSKSILIVPLTAITAGIMYSALFTIPFIQVANYHTAETVVKCQKHF